MCMYSPRRHPFVAKQDIVCVKYLKEIEKGKLKTPYLNVSVPIGKPFIPHKRSVELDTNFITYSLSGGVIHAMTREVYWHEGHPYKAIIPKGTKYWIDARGACIAAKKMIIFDRPLKIYYPNKSLLKDVMSNAPSEGELSVGDYYIKDRGFISPFEVTNDIIPQIAGVIVGFKGKKPLIWSGEVIERLTMDEEHVSKFDTKVYAPKKDFDGEKHLKAFLENHEEFDRHRFQAYAKCIAYRPEIGKWYIPAFGEMYMMIQNLMFIHAAAWISKSNIFLPTNFYWTSSEENDYSCWYIVLYGDGDISGNFSDKHIYRGICPFLASTNKTPKVKITTKSKQ